jgi:hypothetical protein
MHTARLPSFTVPACLAFGIPASSCTSAHPVRHIIKPPPAPPPPLRSAMPACAGGPDAAPATLFNHQICNSLTSYMPPPPPTPTHTHSPSLPFPAAPARAGGPDAEGVDGGGHRRVLVPEGQIHHGQRRPGRLRGSRWGVQMVFCVGGMGDGCAAAGGGWGRSVWGRGWGEGRAAVRCTGSQHWRSKLGQAPGVGGGLHGGRHPCLGRLCAQGRGC